MIQMLDSAIGLVEPHLVDPAQLDPFGELPTVQQMKTPTQFSVICKIREGASIPPSKSLIKIVKRNGPSTVPQAWIIAWDGCPLHLELLHPSPVAEAWWLLRRLVAAQPAL